MAPDDFVAVDWECLEKPGSFVAGCFSALLLYSMAPDDFVAVDCSGPAGKRCRCTRSVPARIRYAPRDSDRPSGQFGEHLEGERYR
jgi:hypothetical protein